MATTGPSPLAAALAALDELVDSLRQLSPSGIGPVALQRERARLVLDGQGARITVEGTDGEREKYTVDVSLKRCP